MEKLHHIFYTLRADAHIAVNKALAHAIGLKEATLYSELLSRRFYFEAREELTADGFFFNTIEDLRSGTSLSSYQQRLALKNLVKFNLIEMRVSGLPAKRFFRVINDSENMQKLLEDGQDRIRNAPIYHSCEETKQLEVEKLNTNNIYTSENEEIDSEMMRELSILVSAHQQSKPTPKQLLQRTHSLKSQSRNYVPKRKLSQPLDCAGIDSEGKGKVSLG